jgi:hypothetical protein
MSCEDYEPEAEGRGPLTRGVRPLAALLTSDVVRRSAMILPHDVRTALLAVLAAAVRTLKS